jgi:hypothetical protein
MDVLRVKAMLGQLPHCVEQINDLGVRNSDELVPHPALEQRTHVPKKYDH